MLKRIALLFVLAMFCAGAGLPIAPALAAAPAPDDSIPFFGGVKKTPEQQEHDKRIVGEAIRRAGSQEKAEAVALQSGWVKLKAGDATTAIKYFNLAWLIEPKNPDVLWGFGAALNQQRKYPPALKLFEMARKQMPDNADMLADYGYAWLSKGAMSDETVEQRTVSFNNALALLDASQKINPRNPMLYGNRAMIRFFQARYLEAWAEVDKAQALDPESVDQRFLRDLSGRMPRPAK